MLKDENRENQNIVCDMLTSFMTSLATSLSSCFVSAFTSAFNFIFIPLEYRDEQNNRKYDKIRALSEDEIPLDFDLV